MLLAMMNPVMRILFIHVLETETRTNYHYHILGEICNHIASFVITMVNLLLFNMLGFLLYTKKSMKESFLTMFDHKYGRKFQMENLPQVAKYQE